MLRFLDGGTFQMGSNNGNPNETPVHPVTLPTFEMNKTEVTVSQYEKCVDAGACTEPDNSDSSCNWGADGYEDHPVNCLDWQQSVDFCEWMDGRLPSEAEWEYAASNGSAEDVYPWGEEPETCDYAVMFEGGNGCGTEGTMTVCSKPAGNTALGLCDMAGNVWEWVQDRYHENYTDAPTDGSPWDDSGSDRVCRGGAWTSSVSGILRASSRIEKDPDTSGRSHGFRCARSSQ